ncbi:CBS domain-containing protein [Streptomyces sp. NPDC017248]|uniref:CBS domain-containing protein n=1 Tax=unclassified Streptomyces TaxID=2593676 RepID=UPI0037B7AD3B
MTQFPPRTRQAGPTGGTDLTARDAMHAPGPQVEDHMAVDVALSVLLGARVPHLLLRDEDGRCAGLVTRSQLAAHRGGSWYADRTRLRDLPLDRGPFTASAAVLGEAEAAMRLRTLDASPVVDEQGYALGVLALTP